MCLGWLINVGYPDIRYDTTTHTHRSDTGSGQLFVVSNNQNATPAYWISYCERDSSDPVDSV